MKNRRMTIWRQPDQLELIETLLTCEELRRKWIASFCPNLSASLKSP